MQKSVIMQFNAIKLPVCYHFRRINFLKDFYRVFKIRVIGICVLFTETTEPCGYRSRDLQCIEGNESVARGKRTIVKIMTEVRNSDCESLSDFEIEIEELRVGFIGGLDGSGCLQPYQYEPEVTEIDRTAVPETDQSNVSYRASNRNRLTDTAWYAGPNQLYIDLIIKI